MKRFAFKLEAVLRYRRGLEEQRKREFAEVQRLVNEQEAALRALGEETSQAQKDLGALGKGHLDLPLIMAQRRYMLGLELRTARTHARLDELSVPLEQRRAALIAARKETKVLERLRERKLAVYLKDADREEARATDEIAVNQFYRKAQ